MANIPEYMRVRQYVVDLVMSHPNIDERIMSERELCSQLNVARITARRALKGLIDDGWLYVKPGKGMFIHSSKYRSSMASIRKFYKIMIIWGDGKFVHIDGFFMDIMEHLCAGFKRLPVLLQTINLTAENGQTIDELSMYRPDGIIWVRPPQKMAPVIAAMRQKIPVCLIGNPPRQDEFAVTMDYQSAGRLVAAWFLDRNYRRAAFVGQMPEHKIKSEVLTGWLDEFAERKIPIDQNLIIREDEDIGNKVGTLLNGGLDGIFSFGSDFL
ncbi:MAG: GntR family transcriptional regulator, partial [Lentisphaerota bacterium]